MEVAVSRGSIVECVSSSAPLIYTLSLLWNSPLPNFLLHTHTHTHTHGQRLCLGNCGLHLGNWRAVAINLISLSKSGGNSVYLVSLYVWKDNKTKLVNKSFYSLLDGMFIPLRVSLRIIFSWPNYTPGWREAALGYSDFAGKGHNLPD